MGFKFIYSFLYQYISIFQYVTHCSLFRPCIFPLYSKPCSEWQIGNGRQSSSQQVAIRLRGAVVHVLCNVGKPPFGGSVRFKLFSTSFTVESLNNHTVVFWLRPFALLDYQHSSYCSFYGSRCYANKAIGVYVYVLPKRLQPYELITA